MKKLNLALTTLGSLLITSTQVLAEPSLNPLSWLKRQYTWEQVQYIGGMTIGQPIRTKKGGVSLPVMCNINGPRILTVQPPEVNSAFMLRDIKVRVKGQQIIVSLFEVLDHSQDNVYSWKAQLGHIKPGTYEVVFDSRGKMIPLQKVLISS